ncbi:DUF397 domain-containing protein [Solwaraspora sp. WMMD1047]|uniref:DUF397 domain-containing protein n=1 Tax=Solwaraspora sp. WMMD1047 TaxID=3016102 RepID=UPI002416A33B|nr:DUF397 domain-containing protein [Solwaraspora sp. WMMD1047]MDG4833926.1 DUF397 domain-containing protein [Solwaraspora sp. WMMD1047]
MAELTQQFPAAAWRKSSRSNNSNNCVEVAVGGEVGVRDSKDPGGPVLTFATDGWAAFLTATRVGALHPPR